MLSVASMPMARTIAHADTFVVAIPPPSPPTSTTIKTPADVRPAGVCLRQSAAMRARHLLQNLVDAEARGLLPRRKVLEGLDELLHERLRRDDEERPLQRPVEISVRRDVGPFV